MFFLFSKERSKLVVNCCKNIKCFWLTFEIVDIICTGKYKKMEVILAVIIAAAAITAYFPQVASAVDVHPYSRGVKKHR